MTRLICPSCQCAAGADPCDVGQIRSTFRPVPCPTREGASRSSRTSGAGCDGRTPHRLTSDEACGRRSRVGLTPRRRSQPCDDVAMSALRPDTPASRRRRWQQSPITGASTKETVKTIAQGMPERFGVPVVTNSCAFYFAREAAGALSARHSLRPLRGTLAITRARRAAGTPRRGRVGGGGGNLEKRPIPTISCINIRLVPQSLGRGRALWYSANTLSIAIIRPSATPVVAAVEIFCP